MDRSTRPAAAEGGGAALARTQVAGIVEALGRAGQPALVLDRTGGVVGCNGEAERVLGYDVRVRGRRLVMRNPELRRAFKVFLDRLQTPPEGAALPATPLVVRRPGRRPLAIHMLPLAATVRARLPDTCALFTFVVLEPTQGPEPRVLSSLFGLTGAEARLASLVATGNGLGTIAERLGISRETARNYLKSIFAKTETHRQAELVALLVQFVVLAQSMTLLAQLLAPFGIDLGPG